MDDQIKKQFSWPKWSTEAELTQGAEIACLDSNGSQDFNKVYL